MAAFGLAGLSIALALAGGVAIFLGFDDRSPALIPAGAVAIGSAAIVLAVAALVRETRRLRAEIGALSLTSSGAPVVEPPAPADRPVVPSRPAAEEPASTPGALAAVAAAVGGGAAAITATSLAADKASATPAAAEKSERLGEPHLVALPPEPLRDAPRSEPAPLPARADVEPLPVPPPPGPVAEAPPAVADAPAAATPEPAEEEPLIPPPPDIDTILNDIIARRDREHPRRTHEVVSPFPRSMLSRPARAPDANGDLPAIENEETVAPPVESAREAAEPEEAGELPKASAGIDASTPADAGVEEVAAQALVEAPRAGASDAAVDNPAADAKDESGEVASEAPPERDAKSVEIAEPAQAEAASAAPAAEPAAPAPELVSTRKVIRSFSSGPNRYTMYDDGSIEAETPQGRLTFASFDELRRYIDDRMSAPRQAG